MHGYAFLLKLQENMSQRRRISYKPSIIFGMYHRQIPKYSSPKKSKKTVGVHFIAWVLRKDCASNLRLCTLISIGKIRSYIFFLNLWENLSSDVIIYTHLHCRLIIMTKVKEKKSVLGDML